jgi:hypothetical protein
LTRFSLYAVVALAVALAPDRARAQDDRVKRAESFFHMGQQLLKHGKLADACAAFSESEKLDPALGTLLNLADCHAQQRRFATARAEFDQAAQEAAAAGQHERESFAREQLKQLEPLLSVVSIKFDGPPSAVSIDGKDVDARAPLAVDPGYHEFRFAAPGRLARTIKFEVANGPSSQTLDAPRLEPEAQVVPPVERPRPRPKQDDTRRTAAIATAAGGGVALLVGTYFGLHAASKKSDAEPHCNGRYCDADGLSLQDDAHSAATISTIAFGLGIIAVGVGAYLYYTAMRPSQTVAFRVAPSLLGGRLEARW